MSSPPAVEGLTAGCLQRLVLTFRLHEAARIGRHERQHLVDRGQQYLAGVVLVRGYETTRRFMAWRHGGGQFLRVRATLSQSGGKVVPALPQALARSHVEGAYVHLLP